MKIDKIIYEYKEGLPNYSNNLIRIEAQIEPEDDALECLVEIKTHVFRSLIKPVDNSDPKEPKPLNQDYVYLKKNILKLKEKIEEKKAKEEEENAKMVEKKEKGGNKHGK